MQHRSPYDSPVAGADVAWQGALAELLTRSHLVTGDGIPAMLESVLAPLQVRCEVFLVDRDQVELRPLRAGRGPVRVDGTLAGRAYQLGAVLTDGADVGPVLWLPLIDGVERLGLLRLGLPAGAEVNAATLRNGASLSALVAHVLVSKLQQSDTLQVVQRTRPMSVAGELLWRLLPPLTVGSDALAVSAVLEPSYDVSGDAFDYTIGSTEAQFAIFDSSGHDLSAGLTTSVTLAAARSARRAGHDLPEVARRIDVELMEQFTDHRFVTAVLARLDLASGVLRYLVAGHPAPVLLRAGKAVRELTGGRRMPFGRIASLYPQSAVAGEDRLEPGDVLLLHSDGVTEARDATGEEFGVERLVALAEEAAADEVPAPEMLRRLAHAVREHRGGELRDDATLMLVEWSGVAGRRLLPRAAGGATPASEHPG